MQEFIEKCLATVSSRHSARELLNDPFLQLDDYASDLRRTDCRSELDHFGPLVRQLFLEDCTSNSSFNNGYFSVDLDSYNEWGYQPLEMEATGIELFEPHEDDHYPDVDITIEGKRKEDGSIFLRLRITDKEGYFPSFIAASSPFFNGKCSIFKTLTLPPPFSTWHVDLRKLSGTQLPELNNPNTTPTLTQTELSQLEICFTNVDCISLTGFLVRPKQTHTLPEPLPEYSTFPT